MKLNYSSSSQQLQSRVIDYAVWAVLSVSTLTLRSYQIWPYVLTILNYSWTCSLTLRFYHIKKSWGNPQTSMLITAQVYGHTKIKNATCWWVLHLCYLRMSWSSWLLSFYVEAPRGHLCPLINCLRYGTVKSRWHLTEDESWSQIWWL